MELTPGKKLYAAASSAQVVVVKAPAEPVDVRCAGEAMVAEPTSDGSPATGGGDDLLIGKRYADAERGIELLCTRAGAGPLTCDGVALPLKDAKPLPASD